ncbi:MAG TPA: RidA family protein [Methylomirabilota bacterium]|nr:RidA family protein [Methylomirabilota bacterium]
MDRELGNPPSVHPPQAHYSHVARAGQTLYVSGQLALDAAGALVGAGDARAQARQCYRNLAAVLAHYRADLRHLLKTTTYITHWAYRPQVAAARDEVFPAPPYPANTLVVVQGLAEPHFLVEIEGIAVID